MNIGELVLASGNAGKLREMQSLLAPLQIKVQSQKVFNVPDVAETGLTFVENAIIKARHAAQHSGLPCLADDSGLEVDALNGRPGIYSARFAGANASDSDNVNKLLREMADVADEQRSARFRCVLVLMRHAADPTPLICQGTWEGRILRQAQGANGFGYDPVFYVPDYQCSAAELDAAGKNAISHRGQAIRALIEALTRKS